MNWPSGPTCPTWRLSERARFLVTMLTSALAPTNTLLAIRPRSRWPWRPAGAAWLRVPGILVSDLPQTTSAHPFPVVVVPPGYEGDVLADHDLGPVHLGGQPTVPVR